METRSKPVALCEEAWTKGMALKVTDDGFPIVMKPSMNCVFRVQGTRDIAYVGLPKTREEVMAFLATIPRLTADDLESAPDGIYTWLLYSKNGSPPTFAASKTETMLELGTVHYSIALSVGATAVHGAGELWKHGNEYSINFLSGTFMQAWEKQLPPECPLATLESYLRARLSKTVFPYLFRGKSLSFTRTGFVTSRFLSKELTTDKLEAYVRAGFVVCVYDKDAADECKKTKAMCKKPVTLEQMKGGLPPTPRKPQRDGSLGPSQFAEAKRMLDLANLARPQPTAPAPVPASRVEGMGRRRKTRKMRKSRRVTRRRL